MGDLGLISALEIFPGEVKGCPLQYSGLEKSKDCIIHGATKSWTQLSNFHFHFSSALECSFYRYLHVLPLYLIALCSNITFNYYLASPLELKRTINPLFTQHTAYLPCFIFLHSNCRHMEDYIFISLFVYCLPIHDQNLIYPRGRICDHFFCDPKTVLAAVKVTQSL